MATTVGELVVGLVAKTGQFTSGMRSAERQVQTFSGSVAANASRLAKWSGAALGIGSAAAALAAFKNTLDEMDATGKASDRLNIATEKLIGLRYAADLAGGGADRMDDALQKMQINLGMAIAGGGEAAETFRQLGVDINKLSAKAADQQFYELSDAIKGYGTASEQAAAVTKIFGRNASELTNTITLGSEALREHQREIEATGAAYSRAASAEAERVNDTWTKMKTATKGMVVGGLNFAWHTVPDLFDSEVAGAYERNWSMRRVRDRHKAEQAAIERGRQELEKAMASMKAKAPFTDLDVAELGLSDSEKRIRAWEREAKAIGMASEEAWKYGDKMRELAKIIDSEKNAVNVTLKRVPKYDHDMAKNLIGGALMGDGAAVELAAAVGRQSAEAYSVMARRNMPQATQNTDRQILDTVKQQLEEERRLNDRIERLLTQLDLETVEIR